MALIWMDGFDLYTEYTTNKFIFKEKTMYIKLDKKTGKYHGINNTLTYDLQKAATFNHKEAIGSANTVLLSVKQIQDVVRILSMCCSPQPFVIINAEGEFLTETVEVTTDLQKAAVWASDFRYTGSYCKLYVSIDYRMELV